MLLFKRKFLAAIRSGEKTQTIRLWKHRRMRGGQRSYIPGVGHIRITAVDAVDLDRLSDADARPDGFPTAAALREEIARLYPNQLKAGYRAFRVVFAVEGERREGDRSMFSANGSWEKHRFLAEKWTSPQSTGKLGGCRELFRAVHFPCVARSGLNYKEPEHKEPKQ